MSGEEQEIGGREELSDLSWLCSPPATVGGVCIKQAVSGMEDIIAVEDETLEDNVMSQDNPDLGDSKAACPPGKYHKQTYRKAWESLPDFKGWLKEVDGAPNRAFCSFCQVTLFAHRLSLLKHTCTLKHQRAAQKAWLLNKSNEQEVEPDVNESRETSQPGVIQIASSQTPGFKPLPPLPMDNVKFNVQSLKAQHNQISGMTVTIIEDVNADITEDVDVEDVDVEDVAEEPLQLGLNHNIETERDSVIAHYDGLGIRSRDNTSIIVRMNPAPEKLTIPKPKDIMAQSAGSPLTTHVLDTSKGKAVPQLSVSLYRLIEGRWTLVNEGFTTQDGRCNDLIHRSDFVAGRYKLHFDTDRYFELDRRETLYPFIEIVFDVHAPLEHYHIPLLLSPYGYSTYRGS